MVIKAAVILGDASFIDFRKCHSLTQCDVTDEVDDIKRIKLVIIKYLNNIIKDES